jgi:tetratricopeptide (TPR) repeat protein
MLARCDLDLGAFAAALASHERALQALERHFDPHWYTWTQTTALWAHAYHGDWVAARRAGAAAVTAGEAADDPIMVSTTTLNLALVSLRLGDAERAFAEACRAVERAATPADRALGQGALAVVECARGNAEQALPILDAMRGALSASGLVPAALFGGIELGAAYLAVGRSDAARETLTACHALAVQGQLRYFQGRAARLLGELAVAGEDLKQASAHFEEAIDVLGSIGARHDLALAYAARGRLHLRRGDDGPARDDLARALACFQQLDTPGEADRVRAELASLGETVLAERRS